MAIAPSPTLIKAISYCLRPLVSLCIHHGIDYRSLIEILKETFVRVAEHEFRLPGRTQTDSRISLITGVHRKDVHRLRELPEDTPKLQSGQKLAANVISFWLATPELLDANGSPLPVPRTPREGYPWSFAEIVAKLNKDMPPRAVFDQLVNNSIISVDLDDLVHLDAQALVPNKDIDQKTVFFSNTIHDHIAAAAENLSSAKSPFLDRFVWYSDLQPEQVEQLGVIAEKAAMQALRTVNESARAFKNANEASDIKGTQRIHFGTFFYSKRQDAASSATMDATEETSHD